MRITIKIDDTLMREAMKCLGAKTKTKAIEIGLKLDEERSVRQDLQTMRGKVAFWPGCQTVTVPPHAR